MRFLNKLLMLTLCITVFSCQKETDTLTPLATDAAVPVADAGPSKYITPPVSSTNLDGVGISANGPITGYLWSLVSGPNVPVIHSPSSPSTNISGLIPGNYKFQFLVIDSLGYTGTDTTWIRVAPSVPVTLTLQPSNNTVELNFAVKGTTSVCNYGIELDAGAWTWSGDALLLRGATKFDLSSIPATATIVSAKLSLYSNPTPINGDLINANSGSNNAMWIRRLLSPFTIASTWAMQPATETATQVLIPHTAASTLDLVDVDVKNMVSAMVSGGNYGLMMGLQNETAYNIRQFASSLHPDATKHPKLVVVFQ